MLARKEGAGIERVVRMLVEIVGFKNRIFLLEEPENDLHPKALKALLEEIEKASGENQFFVTTHSSIVLKYLAAISNATVWEVESTLGSHVPDSTIRVVSNTIEARREVLRNLGHELGDFDLYEGWLILEESSAERIIRDFLIPYYIPELSGRLGTVAAQGASDVLAKFTDLQRLFLFAHLDPIYKDKAWVIVDAGTAGTEVIGKLSSKFPASASRFMQFKNKDFERYYPASYQNRVGEVLDLQDKREKLNAKRELLRDLLADLRVNPQLQSELQTSAAEVVEKLTQIASELGLKTQQGGSLAQP